MWAPILATSPSPTGQIQQRDIPERATHAVALLDVVLPHSRMRSYVLQHITASMCCVRLCALSGSGAAFFLLSAKSGVEVQRIIGIPAGRDLFGRMADM